ncbi:peptidase [bacterium]|nr:MAG: peptidase [bacterium]
MAKKKARENPATKARVAGWEALRTHPLFLPLVARAYVIPYGEGQNPKGHWASINSSGHLYVDANRRAEPAEWEWVFAHLLLHLAFGHHESLRTASDRRVWLVACEATVASFLEDLKIGRRPVAPFVEVPKGTTEALARRFAAEGIPAGLEELTTATPGDVDFKVGERTWDPTNWTAAFSAGLRNAVQAGIEKAHGRPGRAWTVGEAAREWFMASYPLLGALAASFKIVEDTAVCQRLDVHVAAVSPGHREIYINPAIGLTESELRFVMAHEFLHVGLSHGERRQGRDPYLWNVACDFAINDWLVEMRVGAFPQVGGLLDPELRGLSAEAIYARIVTDLRRFRKLATLRGVGLCDLLGPSDPGEVGVGADLDAWYRSALAQGLELHNRVGRGLLPAGLVQEIRSLSMPPVPWDVRLAQWLDGFFAPLERTRTYARPSRRQASTPEIPRPSWHTPKVPVQERTFGVVIDTSGSMDRETLGQALGATASYAVSREVRQVRVVFCDAAAYDQGYLAAEDIAERVRVVGRGGTVLQPGIDLLENAKDFPKDGPILVITDAQCDAFRVRHEHAVLIPKGARLPMTPRGPVFEMEAD